MQSDDRPAVVFSADNVVAMPLAAAIVSVLAAAVDPAALRIFVIDLGLSPRSRARVARAAAGFGQTVQWLRPDQGEAARLAAFYTRSSRDYPPSAYARLLIGRLLPADVARVVYLDADTVALADVATLWRMPMGGALALAVADMPFRNGCVDRIRRTIDPARHALPADHVYFQSGVMVLDVDGFRREGVAERAFECLAAYPTLTFPDQDALNIVLGGRCRLIDPRWNQMTAAFAADALTDAPAGFDAATLEAVRARPFVVHYSGRPKPWEPGCAHPFLAEWRAAQARTPWAGWRPTGLRRALAWLPRARRLILKRLRRRFGLA